MTSSCFIFILQLTQISTFMEIRPMGAELLHACRQT